VITPGRGSQLRTCPWYYPESSKVEAKTRGVSSPGRGRKGKQSHSPNEGGETITGLPSADKVACTTYKDNVP